MQPPLTPPTPPSSGQPRPANPAGAPSQQATPQPTQQGASKIQHSKPGIGSGPGGSGGPGGPAAGAPAPATASPSAAPPPGASADESGSYLSAAGASKITMFGRERQHEQQWSRTPNTTGSGAIHVKTFHCKLTEDALQYLDQAVNEWLDSHPQYEVKFVSSSIGTMTGKLKEPALICQVWV